LTILRKREAFRQAFDGFAFERVATFTEDDVQRLLQDAGIVRHRGKIEAVINNAGRCLELVQTEGSLGHYVWGFAPANRSRALTRAELSEFTTTDASKAMAKDLKRRGWRFVGPTTVYAFMQSMGLVNDHIDGCATYEPAERRRAAFSRP
jgi:DNA-3-methyladenine glycosylase I